MSDREDEERTFEVDQLVSPQASQPRPSGPRDQSSKWLIATLCAFVLAALAWTQLRTALSLCPNEIKIVVHRPPQLRPQSRIHYTSDADARHRVSTVLAPPTTTAELDAVPQIQQKPNQASVPPASSAMTQPQQTAPPPSVRAAVAASIPNPPSAPHGAVSEPASAIQKMKAQITHSPPIVSTSARAPAVARIAKPNVSNTEYNIIDPRFSHVRFLGESKLEEPRDLVCNDPPESSARTKCNFPDPVTPHDRSASAMRQFTDLYTWSAAVFVTGEGPGALVRIRMRDLCCDAVEAELPLSYFRVTAHGAAQASLNPPLALGKHPTVLGRGHRDALSARKGWGKEVWLSKDILAQTGHKHDAGRVLQTFLLLSDPGSYEIRVSLSLYDVDADMIARNFPAHSHEYENRRGVWVDSALDSVDGKKGVRIQVPVEAARLFPSYANRELGHPYSLPLCGREAKKDDLAGKSEHGSRYGQPLAGRWTFLPPLVQEWPPGRDELSDLADLDPKWLVKHSEWRPYFCVLDTEVSIPRVLDQLQWLHFTGDSNIRSTMHTLCEMGNGSFTFLVRDNGEAVPFNGIDPPHGCIGPSDVENRPDAETGMKVGSSARWVLTYTNHFWPKRSQLQREFSFKEQCSLLNPSNPSVTRGWPDCDTLPLFIQSLSGPGATYFGWGSHVAEWGGDRSTADFYAGGEAFAMEYFSHHPTVFALSTANDPSQIPMKFGKQQVIRNNERIWASNLHVSETVFQLRHMYATRASSGAVNKGNFIPLFDWWSPSHAVNQNSDAVHFDKFFYQTTNRFLMHFLWYAPNYGRGKL